MTYIPSSHLKLVKVDAVALGIVSYYDTADALGDGSDTWVVKITVGELKIIFGHLVGIADFP